MCMSSLSVSQSVIGSVNQTINQSVCHFMHQSVSQSVNHDGFETVLLKFYMRVLLFRLLARYVSRHPVHNHFLKKIV